MALSSHHIGGANNRRETRHRRIARRAISKTVAFQADFRRSLGHQAPNVTAARGAAEGRRPNVELMPKIPRAEKKLSRPAPFRYRILLRQSDRTLHQSTKLK